MFSTLLEEDVRKVGQGAGEQELVNRSEQVLVNRELMNRELVNRS